MQKYHQSSPPGSSHPSHTIATKTCTFLSNLHASSVGLLSLQLSLQRQGEGEKNRFLQPPNPSVCPAAAERRGRGQGVPGWLGLEPSALRGA